MLTSQLHAPCAICNISCSDGLFPPAPAGAGEWRPVGESRVPLCADHKLEVLRGNVPFPTWCETCNAHCPVPHEHPSGALRRS